MGKKRLKIIILITLASIINVSLTGSYFSDQAQAQENAINSICWEPPQTLGLISPNDNQTINSTMVTFQWQPANSSCSIAQIFYKLQIYNDEELLNLVDESEWINETSYTINNLPEGEYWWQIKVKDQFNNTSTSSLFYLMVDYTPPFASLSISNSWEKAVEETITNGDFELGAFDGWTTAGNVSLVSSDDFLFPSTIVNPYQGDYMARIGNFDGSGNFVWENRLMRSFEEGAKSLSLFYNFFSRDFPPFDTPGFFIRINGQEIFRLDSLSVNPTEEADGLARNSGWQQFYYDLSNEQNQKINLALYGGNTGDQENQSWVYIDQITTFFISASPQATYNLRGMDSDIDTYQYKIDEDEWQTGSSFTILTPGWHIVQYRAIDKATNISKNYLVRVMVDDAPPSAINDVSVGEITENKVTLNWTAPGNDDNVGRASSYDVRYSPLPINDANFNQTVKIEKAPSPKNSGETEVLEILGLNPETAYYFAIKSADEAPNISELSNIASATTFPGAIINPGDIVINELMFPGTSVSYADEYLELRNMTDRPINLIGFKLSKLDDGEELDMAIDFTEKTISPRGYFLIANGNSYAQGDSQLKDTIVPDIWDSSLDLSDNALQIKLYDSLDNLIDVAWDGTAPSEGYYDPIGEKYYSIERTTVPGNGTDPLNWYTCIDEASTTDFFEGDADERGTPGGPNRSENEPVVATSAEIILNLSDDKKKVSFKVKNTTSFIKIAYELTYDSENGSQGIVGESDLNQNEFVKDDIVLGTCSSGGTCIYHLDVKNIKLKIDLYDRENKITNLTQSIN